MKEQIIPLLRKGHIILTTVTFFILFTFKLIQPTMHECWDGMDCIAQEVPGVVESFLLTLFAPVAYWFGELLVPALLIPYVPFAFFWAYEKFKAARAGERRVINILLGTIHLAGALFGILMIVPLYMKYFS